MSQGVRDTILSLISIVLVFFYLLLLGKQLGVGAGTDIYFLSVMVIAYLNNLVQSIWDAMQPYYVELKESSRQSADVLYSVFLNAIFLFALFIIFLYFIISSHFMLLDTLQKEFLDIYIFIILFQNFLIFNKKILNLEEHYASYYLVDIFIYSINIITLLWFFDGDIRVVAYSMLLGTSLATVWQFYLIMGRLSIGYRLQLYHVKMREIFKNSFKMKLSSILYDSKEPLFATIFLSFGEGVYSLYNYAIKFSAAIFQVTNTPSINRYLTRLNSMVAKKEYEKIEPLVKEVLYSTVPFFLLVTLSFYFIMPLFLELTFGNKLSSESVTILESIFIYMSLYYLAIVFEAPYTNSMAILKTFNYNLLVNALFALFMLFIYLLFKGFSLDYRVYLMVLIVAQLSNLFLFYNKNRLYLRSKL